MDKDDLMKTYELLCNHYKLQNDSMEKGRTFFWLVESGLFLSWYKISCPMINVIIIFAGIIITLSWFIVFVRFRKAIDLTTDSLKKIERRWLGITNKPNICTKEDNAFRNKRLFSQRLWMDELHPLLFLIAWLTLLYDFLSLLSYLLIIFIITLLSVSSYFSDSTHSI